MSDDSDCISADRPVLRRIKRCQGFYNPRKSPVIEAGAFRPNAGDADGLSFYLEDELSVEELVASLPEPSTDWIVVRLLAKDIFELGLTLTRTTDPGDLPGHVVISEINWTAYQDDVEKRTKIKPAMAKLAMIADSNIVFDEEKRSPK
jgi:hypothetical protein